MKIIRFLKIIFEQNKSGKKFDCLDPDPGFYASEGLKSGPAGIRENPQISGLLFNYEIPCKSRRIVQSPDIRANPAHEHTGPISGH